MKRFTVEQVRALLEGTTTGPWKWEGAISVEESCLNQGDFGDVITRGATTADGRLMAAAPDLAANLIAMLKKPKAKKEPKAAKPKKGAKAKAAESVESDEEGGES